MLSGPQLTSLAELLAGAARLQRVVAGAGREAERTSYVGLDPVVKMFRVSLVSGRCKKTKHERGTIVIPGHARTVVLQRVTAALGREAGRTQKPGLDQTPSSRCAGVTSEGRRANLAHGD